LNSLLLETIFEGVGNLVGNLGKILPSQKEGKKEKNGTFFSLSSHSVSFGEWLGGKVEIKIKKGGLPLKIIWKGG
jgi:hypothetical protein